MTLDVLRSRCAPRKCSGGTYPERTGKGGASKSPSSSLCLPIQPFGKASFDGHRTCDIRSRLASGILENRHWSRGLGTPSTSDYDVVVGTWVCRRHSCGRRVSFRLMRRFLLVLFLVAQPALACAQGTHPITGRQIAGVAGDWVWLDRSEREQEEEPRRAVELIGIKPGMVIADVGAGTGYFTVMLAQRVGPEGKVYANDIQPKLLGILQDKIQKRSEEHTS